MSKSGSAPIPDFTRMEKWEEADAALFVEPFDFLAESKAEKLRMAGGSDWPTDGTTGRSCATTEDAEPFA